jgi:hypothetical protein
MIVLREDPSRAAPLRYGCFSSDRVSALIDANRIFDAPAGRYSCEPPTQGRFVGMSISDLTAEPPMEPPETEEAEIPASIFQWPVNPAES